MKKSTVNKTYIMRQRLLYLVLAVFLIIIGLLSRRESAIPMEVGDALWAMMLYCLFRFLCIGRNLRSVAVTTLLTAYIVEFQQLIRWPWLVRLRSSTIGHLVLGSDFSTCDLFAYTLGVLVICTLDCILFKDCT